MTSCRVATRVAPRDLAPRHVARYLPVMRYFLAIILPPLAVFLCGKPLQAFLNLILTLFFWIPGIIHALFVVHNHLADQRAERIIRAMKD